GFRPYRRRDEGGGGAGAGAEVTDPEPARLRALAEPVGDLDEALGQQADVEAQAGRPDVGHLLLRREEVDEQRREPRLVEQLRHVTVARAEPAAAAAVGEQHDGAGAVGESQVPVEGHRSGPAADALLGHRYTAKGYVSGASPAFHSAVRSSGSTARVSSKCTTASNCSTRRARK